MTETDFLSKYKDVELTFSSLYKYRVTYTNQEHKIWCSGVIEYRDSLEHIEDINEIFNLEDFKFGLLK